MWIELTDLFNRGTTVLLLRFEKNLTTEKKKHVVLFIRPFFFLISQEVCSKHFFFNEIVVNNFVLISCLENNPINTRVGKKI